jgi:hypothetical protein
MCWASRALIMVEKSGHLGKIKIDFEIGLKFERHFRWLVKQNSSSEWPEVWKNKFAQLLEM